MKSRYAFEKLFNEVDCILRPLIDAIDVQDVSKHNRGYDCYLSDKFQFFVEYEKRRFAEALHIITGDRANGSIVDLGCFIPYLPIALSKLGYAVTIVDKYSIYTERLKQCIVDLGANAPIQICDMDILKDDLEGLGRFDVILLMAVVEHLNGSPKELLGKIKNIIKPNGFLYFDVPNIAEFTKRIMLLTGRSPLPAYRAFYDSAYPFMGHNREMTVAEVSYMLSRSGYAVELLKCYDYYCANNPTLKARVLQFMKTAAPLSNKGGLIIAKARIA